MTPAAPQLREFHLLRGKSDDVCRLGLHCRCVYEQMAGRVSRRSEEHRLYVYCSNTANTEYSKH